MIDPRPTSPFATEFLTATSVDHYVDAVAAAAGHIADAFRDSPAPGVVTGSGALRQRIRSLPVAPPDGVGLAAALDEIAQHVVPLSTAVSNPRYVAHLHCPPAISSLAAEVMLSALNQSMDSFDQGPAASAVEEHIIEWMCEVLGYGVGGDGVFTSGGTQSNLQGLLLARDNYARERFGWDISQRGLPGSATTWRVLCTAQTHFTVTQAASLLGLGARSIIPVDTDRAGELDPRALTAAIEGCEHAGQQVIAVVANAGTTDFGVIDPLTRVCEIAHDRGIWVHVDACAAGCLLLSDRHRHLVDGIGGADSVAIDFHKLLFQAISCGALFVRNREALNVMSSHADYLNPSDDDPDETLNLVGKSLQTTRRFDALKILVTLRAVGATTMADMIDSTVAAAAAAHTTAAAQDHLEVIGAGGTNTVVLRWTHPSLTSGQLDQVNDAIRHEMAMSGQALVGRTRVDGDVAVKLTFVNPVCTVDIARDLVIDIAECGQLLADRMCEEVVVRA